MRTTLTLDEDIAARFREEVRRSGRTFREVVNDLLRRSLLRVQEANVPTRVGLKSRALGVRGGIAYDNVGELLERLDGPLHR